MITDEQLEEWAHDFELDDLGESGLEYSVRDRALDLIQALRAERKARLRLLSEIKKIAWPTLSANYPLKPLVEDSDRDSSIARNALAEHDKIMGGGE